MKLTVEFSGLCGFVRPVKPGGPLSVVLLKGDGSGKGHAGHVGGGHMPFLVVNLEDLRPESTSEPRFVVGLRGGREFGGREFGFWDLSDCELFFPDDPARQPGRQVPLHRGIVDMKNLTGHGQIRKECLTDKMPSQDVSARVKLVGGKLTYVHARFPDARYPEPWTFEPALKKTAPPHSHVLKSRVLYDAEFAGPAAVLSVGTFDGKEKRTLVLSLPCQVAISNMPSKRDLKADGANVVLNHCAAFYPLLQDPVPAHPPLPKYSGKPGLGGGFGSFCPPALYEAP